MRRLSNLADDVVQDVRVATRRMRRSPALTTGIILTVALGLGAAAAIFTTFEAALIQPQPYAEPERLAFGIRVALGSAPSGIRRLVPGDALLVGAGGVAVGSIAAMAVSRSMRAVLFGIAPTDWHVYAAVAVGVLGAAIAASLAPALRAGAVNPAVVMRAE